MSGSMRDEAARLLKLHYGTIERPGPPGAWTTLVKVVIGSTRSSHPASGSWSWIEAGPLASARETAAARPESLADFLKSLRQPARAAGPLVALAKWWLRDPSREADSPAWDRPLEALRHELRSLSGVSLTLADRILLEVGGVPAFPLDRAARRIALRHGWLDESADYDEWQAFFVRGSGREEFPLADLSQGLAAAGRDFCGSEPRCGNCPLRAILPASGPLPLSVE